MGIANRIVCTNAVVNQGISYPDQRLLAIGRVTVNVQAALSFIEHTEKWVSDVRGKDVES